jgi:hypothetical protein
VTRRGEGRSRWRGEPAARGGRERARWARGGGGAGRHGEAAASERRGEAAARDRESERRERRRKKNARVVYFLSLPSARDLALGKDFF